MMLVSPGNPRDATIAIQDIRKKEDLMLLSRW